MCSVLSSIWCSSGPCGMKRCGLILVALLLAPLCAAAELVVVMSAEAPVDALTEAEVRQLFTGVTRTVKGHSFTPLDLPAASEVRKRFYRRLAGKSPQQMKAWWARMIFTGKGHPLREVSSSTEQILLVQSAGDYIGYMDSEQLVGSLKVVFRFPE